MTTVEIQIRPLSLGVMPTMRRTFIAAAAIVITLGIVQAASAVCADHAVMYYKHTFYSNAQWPWPYVCPDRVAVQEPFCMMINNGWRRHKRCCDDGCRSNKCH